MKWRCGRTPLLNRASLVPALDVLCLPLERLLSVVGPAVKRFALGPSNRRFGDFGTGHPLGGGEAGAETV